MVEIDKLDVVEPLLDEVACVVVDVAAWMIVDRREELLEGFAVEDVLARVQLERDVDARLVEGVEDRPPAPRLLGEGLFDQSGWALRPRIDVRPGE